MAGLTQKQENFAQAIAAGKSQADAYRAAYNAANSKPETIYSKASVVMADGKVAARVHELREALSKKQLWTREMSVRALIGAYKEGGPGVKISAVRELNLMHGFNAPLETIVTAKQLPTSITEFVIPAN